MNPDIPQYSHLGEYVSNKRTNQAQDYVMYMKISKAVKTFLSDKDNFLKCSKCKKYTINSQNEFLNRILNSLDKFNSMRIKEVFKIFKSGNFTELIFEIQTTYNKKK